VRLEEAADQRDTIWKAHWHEARATRAAAGNAAALHVFDRAIAALDGVRRASLGLRLDSLFLKERLPAVEEAILCAAAHGDAARCLAYADAVKSRFLSSALAAGPPPIPRPDWLEELDQLGTQIAAAEAKEYRKLVLERAALVERIRLHRGPLPVPAGDPTPLLELLAARGHAALQLFLAGRQVVAVLLQDKRLSLDTIELSPGTLAGLRAYATNLMLAHPSPLDFDPQHLRLDAAALVPPRLLDRALGANALVVAPHAALNILPWAALPRDGRRLFEHLPVGQLPCISALPPLAARPAASLRLALLGDPQTPRATRQEEKADLGRSIADLNALYGPGRMVASPVTGRAASTAGFHALLAAPGAEGAILHLACHGRFAQDDPHGSGLLLADRMLSAAEVALRPLSAREVTLAACSTGVRPEVAGGVRLLGDDVVGLPASFLEAGAVAALVSVTPAGDREATTFFHAYHTGRLDGCTPLEAFAAAQRSMLADDRWKIRRWAGFTLYGCA
jgi:CHAT domain-containing protein